MKFGKQLVRSRDSEWEREYVDYQLLNKMLKEIDRNDQEQLRHEWHAELRRQVSKVNEHYERTVSQMERRSDSLLEAWEACDGLPASVAVQQQRHLISLAVTTFGVLERIDLYASLNFVALFKILKKHDKKVGGGAMQTVLPSISAQPFHKRERWEALNARLESLNILMDGEPSAQYHAGERKKNTRQNDKICFWLGFTCMGLINTAVMWAMPETSDVYSTKKFAGILPIFRFFFMLVLLTGLTGWVTMVLENGKVNYIFLLNIDPSIPTFAQSWLSLAASMMAAWLVIFWAFLADFKFNVFTDEGPFLNALIYPVILVIVMVLLLLRSTPSRPAKLKIHLFACLCSVLSAPWRPVTFASNLVGDVLTSFTRPLLDLLYSVCYFSRVSWLFALAHPRSHHLHSQLLSDGHRLNETAESCYDVENLLLCSVLLSLPYVLRLLQCLRRARDDSSDLQHMANALKYGASIVVTFVSAIYPDSLPWFLVCLVASVYSCVWDVMMDWGLFREECRLLRSRHMLPPHYYRLFFVLNVLGRMSWALATLVPKGSMHFLSVSKECVLFALSAFEIYRRAQWAIIRIEHEHLTNSSRFRSLCWVPPLNISESCSASRNAREPCDASALDAPSLGFANSCGMPFTLKRASVSYGDISIACSAGPLASPLLEGLSARAGEKAV